MIGGIVWLTGLSGAGKSTLATALAARLASLRPVELLDGDDVRTFLSAGLGFSRADRDTNVNRIAYVARLLARHGVLVFVAAISPYAETRARLRALGTRTYVQASPEEPDALELGDLLSRQTASGQVRVADSGDRGRGVAIFRADPKVAKRLLDWLAEPEQKKR